LARWTALGAGIVELSSWHGDCCSQRHALPSTCNPEPDYAIAISAGRDGIFDTGDDIKSDEPQ
jgi:hypothetical protein